MKLGIAGLPLSGKKTIFSALTGARGDEGDSRADSRIVTIKVPDDRIDFLSAMYKPKKTIYASIEYLLPADIHSAAPSKAEGGIWNQLRPCDSIIHVVRNFIGPGDSDKGPERDFWATEEDMILSDLAVVEKRLERIELDKKRGKKPEGNEEELLGDCLKLLDGGEALRNSPELAENPLLRGFTFLSAKPMLVIMNNEDEDEEIPRWKRVPSGVEIIAVRGSLEMEITSLSEEDSEEFKAAYNIEESALDRVIESSYRLLKRISFLTVGPDEVRAWPITEGTSALDAAGAIHSDIRKGFIRAEVVSYSDLKECGSMQEIKKKGLHRLEGKEYTVKDGDIINFRFNV